MKSIIRPIEFVSPLSEVEVRLTLKQLCGSTWDNFPFHGEVDKNSFRLIKNHHPFVNTRRLPIILIGDFIGQGELTKVTISLHTRITDIIGLLILVLGAIGLSGYGFVSMLDKGFIVAIASAIMTGGFVGVAGFAISYFLHWTRFHRAAAKIKKALGCL